MKLDMFRIFLGVFRGVSYSITISLVLSLVTFVVPAMPCSLMAFVACAISGFWTMIPPAWRPYLNNWFSIRDELRKSPDKRLAFGVEYSDFAVKIFILVSLFVFYAVFKCLLFFHGNDNDFSFAYPFFFGLLGWIYSLFLVFVHGIRITGSMIIHGQKNLHVRFFFMDDFFVFHLWDSMRNPNFEVVKGN